MLKTLTHSFGALILVSAWACASRPAKPVASAPADAPREEPDGSSLDRAVPVLESSQSAGSQFQRQWLAGRFGRYRKLFSGIEPAAGHVYEVVEIELVGGTKAVVYFDVTAYYGKE